MYLFVYEAKYIEQYCENIFDFNTRSMDRLHWPYKGNDHWGTEAIVAALMQG